LEFALIRIFGNSKSAACALFINKGFQVAENTA